MYTFVYLERHNAKDYAELKENDCQVDLNGRRGI